MTSRTIPMSLSFESPDVEKDFPGLYASQLGDVDLSEDDERQNRRRDFRVKKDKRDKKERGYRMFEEENSEEELVTGEDVRSPSKMKKHSKPSFKLAKKDKFKVKEKQEKEHKTDKEEKQKEKSLKEAKKKEKAATRDASAERSGGHHKEKMKFPKKTKKFSTAKHSSSSAAGGTGGAGGDHEPVFGVPLAVAVERSKLHDSIPLPAIFRECIDYIQEYGLACEGIYRISGVKSKVQALKEAYNRGTPVYLCDYEPNIVASLLKLYLRELPEPVLTNELMPKFELASTNKNMKQKLESMQNLLDELPVANKLLVSWMIVHMTNIIAMESQNKMSLQNVSIVLSPTMQISHRVLNVFFTHSKILFRDTVIKKYVPPLRPVTSRWSLELPDSPSALEEELRKQESLLNQLHEQLLKVKDPQKEDELWEVQRVCTQLKRKLKNARKAEEALKNAELKERELQRAKAEQCKAVTTAAVNAAGVKQAAASATASPAAAAKASSASGVQHITDKLQGVEIRDKTVKAAELQNTDSKKVSEKATFVVGGEALQKYRDGGGEEKKSASDSEANADKSVVVTTQQQQKVTSVSIAPPVTIKKHRKHRSLGKIELEGIQTDAASDTAAAAAVSNKASAAASKTDEVAPASSAASSSANNAQDADQSATRVARTVDKVVSGVKDESVSIISSNKGPVVTQDTDTSGVSADTGEQDTSNEPRKDVALQDITPQKQQDGQKITDATGETITNDVAAQAADGDVTDEKQPEISQDVTAPEVAAKDGNTETPPSDDAEVSTDSPSEDEVMLNSEQYEALKLEHMALVYEEEELLAIGDETRQKKATEQSEIERLRQEIEEIQEIRADLYDSDSSAGSSSHQRYRYRGAAGGAGLGSSGEDDYSDDEDADGNTEHLQQLLMKLTKENAQYERDNQDMSEKIHQEQQICLEVKVQIRIIQQHQQAVMQSSVHSNC